MKLISKPTLKWILLICILAGVSFFSIYQYNTPLWRKAVGIYYILQNHRRLKGIISSYGVYSPLAFILLQVLQIIIAPIPRGAIEFLRGYLFGVKVGFIYSMIGLLMFLIVSTIGRIPGTLMATLQGAKAFDRQDKIFFLLLGVSVLLILLFYVYHEVLHHQIRRLKGERDNGSQV